ncbi:MAG: prepilin-type N-terminal cleavage/methylation domain-containing protein [Patescibacteria group bacterium]
MTSNRKFLILEFRFFSKRSGQSLIEVIIGLAIAAMLIGAAVLAIAFTLRSGTANQKLQIAAGLNRESVDKTRAVASANWNDVYARGKGPNTEYHVDVLDGKLAFFNGSQDSLIEGTAFTTFFSVENVCRSVLNEITNAAPCGGSDTDDPSTQKITVYVRWPAGSSQGEVKVIDYLTRWGNSLFRQTDWSGGPADEGVINEPTSNFFNSNNIDFSASSGLIKLQGF